MRRLQDRWFLTAGGACPLPGDPEALAGRHIVARGKHPNVAVTAIARELIALMWHWRRAGGGHRGTDRAETRSGRRDSTSGATNRARMARNDRANRPCACRTGGLCRSDGPNLRPMAKKPRNAAAVRLEWKSDCIEWLAARVRSFTVHVGSSAVRVGSFALRVGSS